MTTNLLHEECARLRNVSEKAVSILMKYGLDAQLKKSRKLRFFAKNIDWRRFEAYDQEQE